MRALGIALVLCVAASRASASPRDRLLTYDDEGIYVGDDLLVDGAIDDVAYDRAQDLVWYTTGGTLMVVDLRALDPERIPIATGVKRVGFAIRGVSNARGGMTDAKVPIIVVGKKPRVEGRRRGVKLVGKAWLEQQADRAPRACEGEVCDDAKADPASDYYHVTDRVCHIVAKHHVECERIKRTAFGWVDPTTAAVLRSHHAPPEPESFPGAAEALRALRAIAADACACTSETCERDVLDRVEEWAKLRDESAEAPAQRRESRRQLTAITRCLAQAR